jgi:Fumarylacetoacetate (FAA) hydrolase family
MFHPVDQPMERGWVGRIDGEHVIHLAAQTLQAFFTGGGKAREHAVYPLDGVRLLPPVLRPPSVRVFADESSFEFRNPAAVVGPEAVVPGDAGLELFPRLAAVVGSEHAIEGFTTCADWRDTQARPPKDRDFALGLGPVVVTPDDLGPSPTEIAVTTKGAERVRAPLPGFDWSAARDVAAAGTALVPGDILVGPALSGVAGLDAGDVVDVEVEEIGALRQNIASREGRP